MRLSVALIVGGAAAMAGGLYLLRRSSGPVGYATAPTRESRGRVVRTLAPPPPMVDRVTKDGMTVTHYRSASMPIEQRVRKIQDNVYKSAMDPKVRKLALDITRHCPERDGLCEAKAIYDAVKRRVRYTGDIAPIRLPDGSVEGIDYFPSPRRVWEFGGDDCDGHSQITSALLAHNGITPRLRVTSPGRFSDYQHIYTVAGLPKNNPTKWYALDTTLPGNNNFGKEVPYGKHLDFITYTEYAA